jgi:hypothetical protein
MISIDKFLVLAAEPWFALRVVAFICSMAHIIAAGQLLANHRLLRSDGVLAWDCVRLRYGWLERPLVGRAAKRIYEYPNVLWLIGLRLMTAVGVGAFALSGINPFAALALLVAFNALVMLRTPFGSNAADEMLTILTLAVCIGLATQDRLVATASLLFIGGQAVLAYMTAGWFKLFHRGWYDGSYITDLFSTSSYGTAWMKRSLHRSPLVARVTGMAVVIGESFFFLLIFVSPKLCVAGLLMAMLFHVGTAVIMGLNLFAWSFPASYTGVLFCNLFLHGRGLAV